MSEDLQMKVSILEQELISLKFQKETLEKENDKLKLELKKYASHCKYHGDRICNTSCGRCD
jgi:FtsZ-binding cell division protein ZapB